MKTLFFILLLTGLGLAQPQRNVLTERQKDTVKTIVSDTADVLRAEWKDDIEDSLDNYVDKTTTQTITGQKNFGGTIPIKLNSDSSMWLGGIFNNKPVLSRYNLISGSAEGLYASQIYTPPDTSLAKEWAIEHSLVDSDTARDGMLWTYRVAYNPLRVVGSHPWMATAMEPVYEVPGTGVWYEWWYGFDYPANGLGYSNRPLAIAQLVPYSGNEDSIIAFANITVDDLWLGNVDGTTNHWDFHFPRSGTGDLAITDTFRIDYNINNQGWLYQEGNVPEIQIELSKADELNNVFIYPNNGDEWDRSIRLGAQLIGLTDSSAVKIGKHTRDVNGIAILSGNGNDGVGIYGKKSENLIGLLGGNVGNSRPSQWEANDASSFPASLFLGGKLLIGVKSTVSTPGIYLANRLEQYPVTVSEASIIFTQKRFGDADLYMMNAAGVVTQLNGNRFGTVTDHDVNIQRDSVIKITVGTSQTTFEDEIVAVGGIETDAVIDLLEQGSIVGVLTINGRDPDNFLIEADLTYAMIDNLTNILYTQTIDSPTVVTGNLVYLDSTTWIQADADSGLYSVIDTDTMHNTGRMLGIYLGYSGGHSVRIAGRYTTTGLTPGLSYFASTTAGAITAVEPSGNYEVVRHIGYALSATVLLFEPSKTFLTVGQ